MSVAVNHPHSATASHAAAGWAVSQQRAARGLDHAQGTAPARGTDRSGQFAASGIYLWSLRGLAVLALGFSAYLAWVALTAGKVAGCGSGSTFDCGHVLSSRWSTAGGIPVGVPATILYAVMVSLLFVPASLRRFAAVRWNTISFAAIAAGLAALWFIGLQIFAVQHLCIYCLGAHACGIALAVAILWRRPAGARATLLAGTLAAIATSGLITTQVLATPPATHEIVPAPAAPATDEFEAAPELFEAPGVFEAPAVNEAPEIFEAPVAGRIPARRTRRPSELQFAALGLFSPSTLFTAQVGATEDGDKPAAAPRKTVSFLNGVRLDVKQWPLVGTPDADYFFVEMLDYTCSHCRATHSAVSQARQAYGGRLAVVILPTPLDRQCNPHATTSGGQHADACRFARLAIAVWRLKPEAFEEYHHWLLTAPLDVAAARRQAAQVVGEQELQKELDSGTPDAYIAKNVELYKRAGAGAIPKLLFPKVTSVGEMRSGETLKSLVDQHVVNKR